MDLQSQLQAHLGQTFVIERELGGGGMSRVFLANEVRLGRKVVIKVLSPDLVQGINAQRFEREILLAASLQQANIVPVLSAGEVDGLPYFTMPYVDGESLRKRLSAGPIPIHDVIAILRDVTKALAYAHARGIVHRDIKPDNVLLSGGTAVVTDFGIAKALSASRGADSGVTLTQLGTAIGTPAYMAPEQVAGDPNLDHRVDLYALGCVAHELLTGQAPFADRTPQKVLAAHLSEAAVPVTTLRADCPPALATLVTHLLRKDPADRVQSAVDVLHDLDAVSVTSSQTSALSAPGMLPKALALYVLATGAAAILAKAAVVGIGLPDWVFPGTMIVMLLGLPALLITAYVKRVARQAIAATPTLTPGGTTLPRPPGGTIATLALKANPHVSWRRTARGGMYTMGAFVVVIAGFMTLRALGIGPWGSLLARGALAHDSRIVLASFSAAPDDSSLAPIVGEAVRAALSQSTSIRVMDPVEVAPILQQMKRAPGATLDAPTAREVATRSGAAAVLTGRLARAGTGYAVSLELTRATDGSSLASYQATADGPKDLLTVVDGLAKKLRGRIGESLRQVQRAVPLAQATTSSLEALRIYSEAAEANDVDQDFDRAVQLARQAVAIDSTFALAWRKLAVALVNSSSSPLAVDSALDQAMKYADRLPDREKYLVHGFYYEQHRTQADPAKALTAYQAVYAVDSSNTTATNEMMRLYGARGEYDSSSYYARRQFEIQPNVRNGAVLAGTLSLSRGTDAAGKLLDSIVRADPGAAGNSVVLLTRFGLDRQLGLMDSAAAVAGALSRSPQVPTSITGQDFESRLATVAGQLSRATTLYDQVTTILAKRGGAAAIDGMAEAEMDIRFRGRSADGVRRLDGIVAGRQWAAAGPIQRPYTEVATLYALAGNPDRARTILARYQQEDPEGFRAVTSQPDIGAARGEIALAAGNTAEALQQFRNSRPLNGNGAVACSGCVSFNLARAFDRAGQTDSAIAEFERYLGTPVVLREDFVALAAVHKRLGELYDGKNEPKKAIEQYAAFTDQWKNADADLQPVVTDVRKRLNELRSREGQ
ncbi:MAG TPA: protein kinase [Gemmatimonadales bacterium]|nr:protein kinase [Gemmatimonadales bacterium]